MQYVRLAASHNRSPLISLFQRPCLGHSSIYRMGLVLDHLTSLSGLVHAFGGSTIKRLQYDILMVLGPLLVQNVHLTISLVGSHAEDLLSADLVITYFRV